jgi:hypothetical protein
MVHTDAFTRYSPAQRDTLNIVIIPCSKSCKSSQGTLSTSQDPEIPETSLLYLYISLSLSHASAVSLSPPFSQSLCPSLLWHLQVRVQGHGRASCGPRPHPSWHRADLLPRISLLCNPPGEEPVPYANSPLEGLRACLEGVHQPYADRHPPLKCCGPVLHRATL